MPFNINDVDDWRVGPNGALVSPSNPDIRLDAFRNPGQYGLFAGYLSSKPYLAKIGPITEVPKVIETLQRIGSAIADKEPPCPPTDDAQVNYETGMLHALIGTIGPPSPKYDRYGSDYRLGFSNMLSILSDDESYQTARTLKIYRDTDVPAIREFLDGMYNKLDAILNLVTVGQGCLSDITTTPTDVDDARNTLDDARADLEKLIKIFERR